MKNIQVNKEELLNRLNIYFPNVENIRLSDYKFGFSDYAILHSDLLSFITQYFKSVYILFYFYDKEINAFELVRKISINNIDDVQKVERFYFTENIMSNKYSYFYIVCEEENNFLILSDDSLDYSLLLYNKRFISSRFIDLMKDYFII